MGELTGLNALVTGASSGIGAAVVEALAAEGVRVAAVARRAERLESLVGRVTAAGGTAMAVPADIGTEAGAIGAVERAIESFGRLDILVNVAGTSQAGNVETTDLDDFRAVMDVNLMGPVYTCRAAMGPMKAQGSGDIINVSSMSSKMNVTGTTAYGLSKGALNHLTEGLRAELGPLDVRVCLLVPGRTRTEFAEGVKDAQMRGNLRAHLSVEDVMEPSDLAATLVHVLKLPRSTTVAEIVMHRTRDRY